MNTFEKTLLASAIVAAFAPAVLAEELQTQSVKVTASRVERELMDVNMSVSVITAEDIKRQGARTVGEILQNVPGVRINNDGGQGIKRAMIRGNDAFQTLVLIDGQKISEQKSMSGSPFLIAPAMIERIEVIKGPASVLYGSEALGGVINIITKKGGDKALSGDVSLGYNSASKGRSGAASLYGAQSGWHYRVGVAADKNSALDTPEGKMPNSYFQSQAANFFLAYDLSDTTQLGATLDYYKLKFGSGQFGYEGFAVDVPKWERYKVALFGEMKNISQNLVRARADVFYQGNDKEMINTVPMNVNAGMMKMSGFIWPIADNSTDQWGIALQTDWQLADKHYLIFGYDYNRDNLLADSLTNRNYTMTMTMPRRLIKSRIFGINKNENYDGYQSKHAIYANMESQLPKDFALNYGVRYTRVYSDMNQLDRLKNTATHEKTSDGKAVFNAGLSWHGIEDLTLRAAFSQGYLFPLLQHLYVPTNMGSASSTWNNPDLKPETSNNFEVGARFLRDGVSVDGTVFYTDSDDFIATQRIESGANKGDYKYYNVAQAKTLGLELATSWDIHQSGIEPYVTATILDRRYIINGKTSRKTGQPTAYGQYGVRWNYPSNGVVWRLDAYGYSQNRLKSSAYSLGGATTWNLLAGVTFGKGEQFDLDLSLYNLGDKKYQYDASIYEAGRSFALKFNARF